MTGFTAVSINEENSHQKFKGVSRILGPAWAHLPALTIGFLGVQIFWSVEMSYASPYLLSLGLSKSSMAIVFLAGPLSGLIMQPLIGVLADNSTSRFGRRRPYMLLGTAICIVAMLLLGFTRPVASVFTGSDNDANDTMTIWLAVVAIYLVDFSINAVQAVDRALLVDTLRPSEQPAGNAWAARMLGIGSVIGFFVGNINLRNILPFLGKTQLEVLSVIVSVLLLSGHVLMSFLIKERVLLKDDHSKAAKKSFIQEVRDIWFGMLNLPPVIRKICMIQFFAWLAWFPILFYTTIYVGDLYKRAVLSTSNSPLSEEDQTKLNAEATRLGSRALFYSSLVSLFCNVVLPYFVSEASFEDETSRRTKQRANGFSSSVGDPRAGNIQARWQTLVEKVVSFRVPRRLQFHLASLWAFSHLVMAACMFATFLTSSVFGATLLITFTGFSWAITQWAPFSLLGEAILTEPPSVGGASTIMLTDTRTRDVEDGEPFLLTDGDGSEDESDGEDDGSNNTRLLASSAARVSRLDINNETEGASDTRQSDEDSHQGGLSAKAGIILGIHNIFIVIPQFLVTGISAIIFAIFDPNKSILPSHHGAGGAPSTPANGTLVSTDNSISVVARLLSHRENSTSISNSVVYVFRLGGIAAAVAWILCWRLTRELKHRGL
ncbi:hypothetical protein M378DRAFT_120453 [Amanita muscaria Koide BX008]|uniref:Sucrose transporter n=1 Tax=Amanita muscaria (strain Koide BX008) TaxID=946122 RepID=A0A0C2XG40_AMAMK|nr:hypothetical protein M378DRAFT_120453 [Amanita muscaria Koide BX008]